MSKWNKGPEVRESERISVNNVLQWFHNHNTLLQMNVILQDYYYGVYY